MEKNKTVAFYLPEKMIEFLDDVANQWVCSRSDVLRHMLSDKMREWEGMDELREITIKREV